MAADASGAMRLRFDSPRQILIDDIQEIGVHVGRYFFAIIEKVYPVHSGGPRKKTAKLVLQQEGKQFYAFFFGNIAQMCADAKEGDAILCKDPNFGIAPRGQVHKYQLELCLNWSRFAIWFISTSRCGQNNIRSSMDFVSGLRRLLRVPMHVVNVISPERTPHSNSLSPWNLSVKLERLPDETVSPSADMTSEDSWSLSSSPVSVGVYCQPGAPCTPCAVSPSPDMTSEHSWALSAPPLCAGEDNQPGAPCIPRADTPYVVPAGYVKLGDLKVGSCADIYGVVQLFKPPWKSRGTDFCSVVYLMDPSLPLAAGTRGFECVMFQSFISQLPKVLSVGDVVRLQRVRVSQFNGQLQGKSSAGFTALVFDHDPDVAVSSSTARATTPRFDLSQADIDTVQMLKRYFVSSKSFFPAENPVMLKNIAPSIPFDVCARVVRVSRHERLDCVAVRVVDGSLPAFQTRTFRDGDEFSRTSAVPYSQASVDIFLLGRHATAAVDLNIHAGLFVKIHGVCAQVYERPSGGGGSLLDEGSPVLELCLPRGDPSSPDCNRGVTVLPRDSPEAQAVRRNLR